MKANEIDEYVPESVNPEDWHNIVLGADAKGQPDGTDLRDSSSILAVGETGSGKTIALQRIAMSALSRGHEVVLIDTVKDGTDFLRYRDWFTAFATTDAEASEALLRVHNEVARRKEVLSRTLAGFWGDVPEAIRQEEKIVPLTVIIDNFDGLVRPMSVPKWSETVLPGEAQRLKIANAAKTSARQHVEGLAREARSVGVHLVVALQHPSPSIISDEFRSNLPGRVLMVSPRKQDALADLADVADGIDRKILFTGAASEAVEIVRAMRGTRGLAVIGHDGRPTSGVQVALVRSAEVPEILTAIGVPKPERWELGRSRF